MARCFDAKIDVPGNCYLYHDTDNAKENLLFAIKQDPRFLSSPRIEKADGFVFFGRSLFNPQNIEIGLVFDSFNSPQDHFVCILPANLPFFTDTGLIIRP